MSLRVHLPPSSLEHLQRVNYNALLSRTIPRSRDIFEPGPRPPWVRLADFGDNTPSSLKGLHQKHILYLIDQLFGQNRWIDEAKLYVKWFLLFQKRSKRVSSASQKITPPRSRRSRPRGSGGVPLAKPYVKWSLLFQKKSKSVSSASQKITLSIYRRNQP
jgi:hypothetical protein